MEPLSNVNIQDVLRHQMQNQDGQGGLRMGGGGGSGIRNNELGIRNGGQGGKSLISNPSSLTKTSDVPIVKKPEVVNKAQEIDKKLEDLEKRVKG
jgi:hypothetical protein